MNKDTILAQSPHRCNNPRLYQEASDELVEVIKNIILSFPIDVFTMIELNVKRIVPITESETAKHIYIYLYFQMFFTTSICYRIRIPPILRLSLAEIVGNSRRHNHITD